jgi:hypothetical protein
MAITVDPSARPQPGEVEQNEKEKLDRMEIETRSALKRVPLRGEKRINRHDAKDAKRRQKAEMFSAHG